MNKPQQQGQRVNIPAVQIPVEGLKAEYHLLRHSKKLHESPCDAGMDLFPSEIEKVTEHGHLSVIWVHTFINIGIPVGFRAFIEPRSSSLDRLVGGMVLPGIIDAGYTGEIMIRVGVPTLKPVIDTVSAAIKECQSNGLAIAQVLYSQNFTIVAMATDIPPEMRHRGTRGFGSSDQSPKLVS